MKLGLTFEHDEMGAARREDGGAKAFEPSGEGRLHGLAIFQRGMAAAGRYLERFGYEILERDWECPAGSADIIARDREALVFCEVKTYTDMMTGFPSEAPDGEKRARDEKVAAWYLQEYEEVDIPVRFDVVALLVVSEDRALIRHYVNAYSQPCN